MINIYKLFVVLDKWKAFYILAGCLLAGSSLFRMLEPKILQMAIDGVILFRESGEAVDQSGTDWVSRMLYGLIPDAATIELTWKLACIGLIFVAIASLEALFRFLSSVITADSTEKAIKKLRDRLFAHIQALPLAHFGKVPSADMIQRCTGDVDTVRRFISNQISELIRLVSLFFGAFILMFLVHQVYAVIAISLVPLIMITALIFFKKESTVWQEHEAEQDKLTGIIQENLSGIRVVQAFAQEEFETEKFVNQNKAKLKIGIRHVDLHMKFWPFSDFLINAQVALSLLAGGYFTLSQQISVGEFASFFTYSIMVTWPMRGVGRIMSQLGMASVAMERISEILDAEQEDYSGLGNEKMKLQGKIEFKSVSFKYPGSETYALEDVSFDVMPGEKIALLGPTGSGKSTIIALLARFFEPEKGEIILDGKNLKLYNKTWLRSRFGVVHQNPFLFSTSIRENIAYVDPEADEKEVEAVAESAAIFDFIQKLNNGFDTLVGEKGVTLSGGQKQRVALARALLGNPDILVLDDATSAVDTETEFAIQNALKSRMKNKTTFLIAHRLTSIQQAEKVLVLKKGKVVEQGTHLELLKSGGFYKKVFDIQVSLEEDIKNEIIN